LNGAGKAPARRGSDGSKCSARAVWKPAAGSFSVASASIGKGQVGIGFNSVSSPSGTIREFQATNAGGSNNFHAMDPVAEYTARGSIGIYVITALENGLGSNANAVAYGGSGEQTNALIARWNR
jgi:hypothetical protein